MENRYDAAVAEQAQKDYSDRNKCPIFAPRGGICHRCGRNIYGVYETGNGLNCGYSVKYAEEHLITRCPFCSATFTD